MLHALATADDAAAWLGARLAAAGGTGRLRTDSRAVQAGDALLAWAGRSTDGRRHVAVALAAGAAACLVDADGVEHVAELAALADTDAARVAMLPGLQAAAGAVAAAVHGQPSARLQVLAVTGTNGKTSTAWWTAQALTALGRRCGMVGTLGIGEPPRAAPAAAAEPAPLQPTGLTTPDAVALQAALADFAARGFAACAIEASSIGIARQRLAAVQVAVALFTNFTRDHLDFHGDMATYWAAKRQLFAWPGLQAAIVNVDDLQGATLAAELQGTGLDLWTVAVHASARLCASHLRYVDGGLAFDVTEDGAVVAVQTRLVGDFNASNLLGVLGGLRALGIPLADAARICAALQPVPGRLQRVPAPGGADAASDDDVQVVVDYAHTPDALDKVLQALRPLVAARGGQLWCVFGCGGNRDATKRPLMGAIAARGADQVVVTSDNPRDEAPAAILAQILAGVAGHDDVAVIEDRHEAIAHAVRHAAAADVVLLAGKGHEDTQEMGGVKRPFSDLAEASAALQRRQGVTP